MTAADDISKIARLEKALKIISTWADFTANSGDTHMAVLAVLAQIADKADKALKGE